MPTLKKFQKICEQNPTSILFARLADAFLQQGDTARAIEICRRGLRYRPAYTAGHVVMGKCYHAAGHYEEARLAFQKVLQLDAGHLAAHWYLGKIALQLGRRDLALNHFEQAHARDPFGPELIEQIRKLKGEEDRDHSAEIATDSAGSESAPFGPELIEQIRQIKSAGDRDNRVEIATDSAGSESETFAQALLDEEEDESDLDALVTSFKREPKSENEAPVIATPTLAELYASQGLIPEAIAVLEQVIAREPDNAQIIARLDALRNLSE